jgi:DNA-binding transcriptional ArsR family regulator
MVESSPKLDRVFSALADPTRREILARLRAGDASVGEVAAPFEMSLAAVSKHLDVLERAGLVHREARGRERRCHLDARPLRDAADWADAYRRLSW